MIVIHGTGRTGIGCMIWYGMVSIGITVTGPRVELHVKQRIRCQQFTPLV